MTTDGASASSPDALEPRTLSDTPYLIGAALAIAASLSTWTIETPAIWEFLEPAGRSHAVLGPYWRAASDLARGPALIAVLAFAFLFLRDANRRQFVLSSALGTGLLGLILKVSVQRPRPIAEEGGYSWPSGHTASAVCFALALTISSSRSRRWKAMVWFGAVSVALSRTFLVRHWPSDVLAGCGVAMAAIPIARRLPRLRVPERFETQTLLRTWMVGLCLLLTSIVIDPHGRPIPRGWGILICVVACLHALNARPRIESVA